MEDNVELSGKSKAELRSIIEDQNTLISDLKQKISDSEDKTSSTECNGKNCSYFNEYENLKIEFELNIVDSKIKIVNLVDKLNDLEYRNERLQSLLASSPGRFSRLAAQLGKSLKGDTDESEKTRRSLLLMRSLSVKMNESIPSDPPESVMFGKRCRANLLFEALVLKLEEFRKVLESCTEESLGTNFIIINCSLMALLNSFNSVISSSVFLQQQVCFIRSSNSSKLVNLISSEEDDFALENFRSFFKPNSDGSFDDEISFDGAKEMYHPFVFTPVSKIQVEQRYSGTKLRINFVDKKFNPSSFGRIIVRRMVKKKQVLIRSLCFEVFRLFNQIWKFKNIDDNQSPPSFSVFEISLLSEDMSAELFIDNLIPIAQLGKTKLNDSAREAITYSVAGTAMACFIIGINIRNKNFFFNKKGRVFLLDFDNLFNTLLSNFAALQRQKSFSPKLTKIFFPKEIVSFFGNTGIVELSATCILAFLNIRKFSTTVIRFVKMTLGPFYGDRLIEEYISCTLMTELKFEEVEKEIKRIIKASTGFYKRRLKNFLDS